MALSDIPSSLRAYWGVIRSNVFQRATTTQLWQAISGWESQYNILRPGGLFNAVTAMRSLAVGQRNAENSLASAAPEDPLTADMIAQDINSRPVTEQSLSPSYLVRFEASMVTEIGNSTRWLTVKTNSLAGMIKDDLLGQLDTAGIDMSTGYGELYTGLTGQISIVAV
ncbi:MAG TPA: hypothetical protein VHT26_07595 [Trebonia sp.]|jgi:hypothetical protein|nr:hypothetical protein [Trebonia sp.]